MDAGLEQMRCNSKKDNPDPQWDRSSQKTCTVVSVLSESQEGKQRTLAIIKHDGAELSFTFSLLRFQR